MEEVTLAQILRDRWHSADWKQSVTSEEGMLCGDALVWTSDFMCNVEGDYTTNPRSSCEAKWRTEWYRLHFSTQLPTGAEIRRAGPRYTLKVWGVSILLRCSTLRAKGENRPEAKVSTAAAHILPPEPDLQLQRLRMENSSLAWCHGVCWSWHVGGGRRIMSLRSASVTEWDLVSSK